MVATAKATGAGGEAFVSSLRIVNPGTTEANVTMSYLAQSAFDQNYAATGDNTGAPSVTVKVGAGQMLALEDIIGTQFGGASPFGIVAGGIGVLSDQPVSVLSRTYVANGLNSAGVPGTYGFSIPAQSESEVIAAGETGYVSYIAASPNRTSGFRCNLLMLNTASGVSVVHLALKKSDGAVVGERDYTLGRLSAAQLGDVSAAFGYAGPDQNLFVVVTVKSGGPVAIGASVIDNAISSLNYAPPSKTVTVKDGAYGITWKNDPFYTGARLDWSGNVPVYFSGLMNVVDCSANLWLFAVDASYGSPATASFVKQPDGSFTLAGTFDSISTDGSHVTNRYAGSVKPTADGGVTGTVTLTQTTGPCGLSGPRVVTRDFLGHYSAPLNYF